jgi:alpha,alpha-trehalose phosphorylase
MSSPNPAPVDPWCIVEEDLDLTTLARSESLFALANGHLGLRGNLEEGEPCGALGTYLASVYERRPLAHAEAGYGYPESGQTIVNVTNGKLMRLLIDDEPFDVRYGRLRSHRRSLDMRDGCLRRATEWLSPAGQAIRLDSTRIVSLSQRSIAAIEMVVEPVARPARIVVQSELVANEPQPAVETADPRVAAALDAPLVPMEDLCSGESAILMHCTRGSGLRVAAAMAHEVETAGVAECSCDSSADIGRFTVTTVLEPGQTLRIVKFLAYGWSSVRSRQALHDQVAAALTGARHSGWDGLLAEQRAYLDDYWDRADVEVAGDAELQQALRFALFHLLQAGARAERRPIPAKGLTGSGYDGHVFWDSESFVLPVLAHLHPQAVADALRWRHSTLPMAKDRAEALHLKGASFPWRTINGEECSGYWPAGTAAFHNNAAIAEAVVRYVDATEDIEFEREIGLDLLVETARLWASLGHHDRNGSFRIDGITGPDEYSAVTDNNVYTNLMAQMNLRAAADAAERHPVGASALQVRRDEVAAWRLAADAMFIPYDEDLGVHPQSEGFTDHQPWDFAATSPDQYPLLRTFPYFELYRRQVVKQADLVLAMHLRGDAFDEEQKARNFAYYEPLTVRDSSLSAPIQAVIAAQLGHLDLAYDHLTETALIDLRDLHHNTGQGLHIAAMAGAWTAVVAGFGGLRARDGVLQLAPRLPTQLHRITFNVPYRGRRVRVTIGPTTARYELRAGEPIEVEHHGHRFTLDRTPTSREIPVPPSWPRPGQPPGRGALVRDA